MMFVPLQVFDIAQIAPSPAPRVVMPGTSAPQLAAVDEKAGTRSSGETTFLPEEAQSLGAVAMPAMGERS